MLSLTRLPSLLSRSSLPSVPLSRPLSHSAPRTMKHHLMVGTWTPPGRIYTVAFDDEALTLELVKKTDIPEAEPISWMTFSVRIIRSSIIRTKANGSTIARQENHLWRRHEEMEQLQGQQPDRHRSSGLARCRRS
jgi:hypothetical protein